MHNLDHGRLEAEAEFEHLEHGERGLVPFEFEELENEAHEAEFEAHETESLFCENGEMCEAQETELALELLEVSSEAELEAFLGNLARRAVQTGRGILSSPDMRAVGGILKGAAGKALPHLGSAIGGHFGGATGAKWGGRIAGAAGQLFGLELEGLSGEDKEFELARAFVRFAGNTVRNMTRMANSQDAVNAARTAAAAAARIYAPGLFRLPSQTSSSGLSVRLSSGQSGRWLRRGSKIVLFGV